MIFSLPFSIFQQFFAWFFSRPLCLRISLDRTLPLADGQLPISNGKPH